MFPQITEETEENLLNLEEIDHPPSKTSNSKSENQNQSSPADTTPPDEDDHILPSIIPENVDMKNNSTILDEFSSPPPRIRMRSLSGGTYRLTPVPTSGRARRQSGDDVLSSVSPSRKAAFLDAIRPRSKSDSKSKKPTFLTTLKNSVQQTFFSTVSTVSSGNKSPPPSPLDCDVSDPFQAGDSRLRPRSGSETRSGAMSKVMEMFRNRSNSVSIDTRNKRPSTSLATSALYRRYSVEPDRRRHPLQTYRSLDGYVEHPCDSTLMDDDEVFAEPKPQVSFSDITDDSLYFPRFFDAIRCYTLMPTSAKLVVLDTQLLVKKAFFSLLVNNVRAAPLWDSTKRQYVGMLTITDFINILRHYYEDADDEGMRELENQRIETWRCILNSDEKPLFHTFPNQSLMEAIKILVQSKVHRLPVVEEETMNVLFVITHKRILKYLHQNFDTVPKPSFMTKTIGDLRIGTYENVATATPETTVIEALNTFVERMVSAVPIVENGKVIDIYAKADVFSLAKEKAYIDLDITLRKALEDRSEFFERFLTCTLDDTLESVITRIVNETVHRIIVVDSQDRVLGVISLSDILKYLALRPSAFPCDLVVDSLCKSSVQLGRENSNALPTPNNSTDELQSLTSPEVIEIK